MKQSFKDLIKGVVASSIAAIVGSHGSQAAPSYSFSDGSEDALRENDSEVKKDLHKKLLLSLTTDDDYYLTAHRSHSSHRSGSSHYSSSHYSSTTSTKSTGSSSRSSSATSTSGATTNTSVSRLSSSPTSSLGSRTVKIGMSGEDVRLLSEYFIKLHYMTTDNVSINSMGAVECNVAMIKAAREYQQDKGFTLEDQIDKATALALKEDSSNYRELGSRGLLIGMSGTDISELKNILIEKGVLKGKKKAKYEISTLDETTVDMLEAYFVDNGVEWPGKVNSKVIAFLNE